MWFVDRFSLALALALALALGRLSLVASLVSLSDIQKHIDMMEGLGGKDHACYTKHCAAVCGFQQLKY